MNSQIELFHGTTSLYLGGILDRGLLPCNEVGVTNYGYLNARPKGRVYLAKDTNIALVWARNIARRVGGDSAVITVEVDYQKLTGEFDGESFEEAMERKGHCCHLGMIFPVGGYEIYKTWGRKVKIGQHPDPKDIFTKLTIEFNRRFLARP